MAHQLRDPRPDFRCNQQYRGFARRFLAARAVGKRCLNSVGKSGFEPGRSVAAAGHRVLKHLLERRVADNIMAAAGAHGMTGEQVDGNDALAVYDAACRAAQGARSGGGPRFLECRTYRWRGHVGPALDLDVGVKRRDELAQWRSRYPIPRLEAELRARGIAAAELEAIGQRVEDAVNEAIEFARQSPYPDAGELDRYVFAANPRSDR